VLSQANGPIHIFLRITRHRHIKIEADGTKPKELEIQVMETRKRVLGAEHPDTPTSVNNLTFTWKGMRQDTEAIKLMKECVQP
jgi:tetratricopeptide repeat protein